MLSYLNERKFQLLKYDRWFLVFKRVIKGLFNPSLTSL